MRSTEEWIGKTDDSAVPPRVRLRVFEKFNGVCQLSGRKILAGDAWDLDHIKALWRGGQHRESNLQPVLKQPHRVKSGEEQTEQAKADRIKKKHFNMLPKKPWSKWKKKMNGEVVPR
ncbi:HNH endonuclease [Rhizobium leguminosarum]|uniref:HNH endonuclease n=1 Tax=Rhizobium leguminosarum TaxID=384 RepID=UPI001C91C90A|nr:HNH endonuclease [Rhizobium leguminosarum]MBY2986432.1 HNH endonuclease [Rhizobium leguminosarum]